MRKFTLQDKEVEGNKSDEKFHIRSSASDQRSNTLRNRLSCEVNFSPYPFTRSLNTLALWIIYIRGF